MSYGRALVPLLLVMGLTACGGGDSGGTTTAPLPDGMMINAAGTVTSAQTLPATKPFPGVQQRAYSARLLSTTGDADLYITDAPATAATGNFLDAATSSGVDDVSFIVPTSKTYYALIDGFASSSNYNLKVYNNHLTVNGSTRTRTTKSQSLYFSFNAVAGQAYNVSVTPTVGDANLSVYSGTAPSLIYTGGLLPDIATLIGQSNNTGTQAESIVFVASETKTHYLSVSNANTTADMTFSALVETSTAAADLQVSVNSLSYSTSTGNLTVNYTVSNTGSANSSPVNLHFWLDSATPPTAASVSDDLVSIGGIASNGTYTASRSIPVGALTSGTFYAYVDLEDALVEADETNNVSAARAWSTPVLAPQVYDFEDSLTPAVLIPSGDTAWTVVPGGAYATSNYSFRSGTLVANQTSCFEVSTNGAKTVKFDWKALTDTTADSLKFYVNGGLNKTYAGANLWTAATYTTWSTGLNTFKWCYIKGNIDNVAVDDGGWVDNIEILPEQPDLSVTVNSATSDGTNLTISYTVTNNTAAAAAATTVDLWANLATAPTVGLRGDVQMTVPVIAGNGSYTGSIAIATAATSGTAYAIIDTNNTLSEQNETNNVSTGQAWMYYGVPLATYDFEDGIFPAAFVTPVTATAGWLVDPANASTGIQSIRGNTITHNQAACSAVTVANSSAITFDWKVESESCCDRLQFSIDGVLQTGSISGAVNWTPKSFTGLTLGTHEFKWCYTKDGSVSTGLDTGWVDNINVY